MKICVECKYHYEVYVPHSPEAITGTKEYHCVAVRFFEHERARFVDPVTGKEMSFCEKLNRDGNCPMWKEIEK